MKRYIPILIFPLLMFFSIPSPAQTSRPDRDPDFPPDIIEAKTVADSKRPEPVSAGGRSWTVKMYSKQDGLPADAVASISTIDGLPYVGTTSGVCDFDGKEWRIYPDDLGFPTGTVHFLLVLEDVGAMALDSGFRLYYQNYMWDLDTGAKGTSGAALRDGLYLGAENGLFKVGDNEIRERGFRHLPAMGAKAIISLAAGGPDALWAAATDGIYLVERETVTRKYPLPAYYDPGGDAAAGAPPAPSTATAHIPLPADSIKIPGPIGGKAAALYTDAYGVLWAATDKGINRYDPGTDEWRLLTCADGAVSCSNATSIGVEGGRLWAGTPGGAAMWDGAVWIFFRGPDFLPDDGVTAVAAKSDGGAWLGTSKGISWIEPAERRDPGAEVK